MSKYDIETLGRLIESTFNFCDDVKFNGITEDDHGTYFNYCVHGHKDIKVNVLGDSYLSMIKDVTDRVYLACL